MTGTVRPAPTPVRPPPPAIGPAADRRSGRTRRARRVGSGRAADALAHAGRRRHRRRHAATAGNLVFQVLSDGRLVAYSADKGEKLLEIQTGLRSGMGPPITYRVDGQQYVALMGGVGTVTLGQRRTGQSSHAVLAEADDVRARWERRQFLGAVVGPWAWTELSRDT